MAPVYILAQSVTVPDGSFRLGNSSGGEPDERPATSVTVSSFTMDKYEVTYAQYDSCVRRGACTPAHYDDRKCLMWTSHGPVKVRVPGKYRSADAPVVCVTWRQARAYCRSKGKRLPTEAEWEYAALGKGSGTYAWGNASPQGKCARSSDRRPLKGGSFPANGFGLYDMTGNVWEWVDDRYQQDRYEDVESKDPKGPPVGRYRVIRGGGWYSTPNQLRVKNRQWFAPEWGEVSLGIRCVK